MPRRYLSFCPDEYYHFYNRGVNREAIYFDDDNYAHFLWNIQRYLVPVANIGAYCLMPNHYHLLIVVKEISKVDQTSEVSTTSEVSLMVSKAMMKLSVSYTKAINHRYNRVGPLFQGAFQAKHIESTAYLWQLAGYIHLNPVEAGLVRLPEDWNFSSCRAYQGSEIPQLLPIDPVIDLRGR